MDGFTPYSSAAGGALIGTAAALLWYGAGRIMGVSGIVGGLTTARGSDIGWRLSFLAGLLAAPLLLWAVAGIDRPPSLQASPMLLITAGLLVGYGTRLGSGCTSGHGVCGLARLSPRSLIATVLFMASGAAVVFVARHLLGA